MGRDFHQTQDFSEQKIYGTTEPDNELLTITTPNLSFSLRASGKFSSIHDLTGFSPRSHDVVTTSVSQVPANLMHLNHYSKPMNYVSPSSQMRKFEVQRGINSLCEITQPGSVRDQTRVWVEAPLTSPCHASCKEGSWPPPPLLVEAIPLQEVIPSLCRPC